MPDDTRPVQINAAQGKRIARAVKAVESSYTPDRRRAKVTSWNPGIMRAKVTTAISSGSFGSPSSDGRAQGYHKDHAGTWKPSGDPVTVYNDHALSASIAVDKVVKLAWCDGDWYLVAADC